MNTNYIAVFPLISEAFTVLYLKKFETLGPDWSKRGSHILNSLKNKQVGGSQAKYSK